VVSAALGIAAARPAKKATVAAVKRILIDMRRITERWFLKI
jgi:hypothetical protein